MMRTTNQIARVVVIVLAFAITASVGLTWIAYRQLGYTPVELIDYAEVRLSGHTRLELLTSPVISELRRWLDAPGIKERRKRKFEVPSPPKLALNTNSSQHITPVPLAASGRILRVGAMESIKDIATAARVATDGDIVEIVAGEYRGDVATWTQKKLTIRGTGGNARLYADGKSAEEKAIWVIRNGEFDISNIDFIGTKVADRNGAGIRFEAGKLRIKNCLFWGNETGLLTTNNESAILKIENSEFGYNGAGDGFSHNLYVGKIAELRVEASYFHHANIGHLLKSRAARSIIAYNRLSDEAGGRASYELDLPNGGVAVVLGNIIQQSRDTENSTLIAFGREGNLWSKSSLYLVNNTIVNDHSQGGAFLRADNKVDEIFAANNILVGHGTMHSVSEIHAENNTNGDWEIFEQASHNDYRPIGGYRNGAFQSPSIATANGLSLTPSFEYQHPRKLKRNAGNPQRTGAIQTVAEFSNSRP
jgi:hypothetical protein